MRTYSKFLLFAAALVATSAFAADSSSPRFVFLSPSEAQIAGTTYETVLQTRAWMWSDNNVYMPGDTLNAWWTVKPDPLGALFPVTIVAYRQNNQTGEKFYLPNGTTEVTDIFGNTMAQGFQITRIPSAGKAALIGNGGLFPAVTIPNELGMHTLVVEFRDYTGQIPLKRLYNKISVVDEIVNVAASLEQDTTWVNTKSYLLQGTIVVRNATLTIEPGTIVKGAPGSQPASALVIRRDSRLIAQGTRSRPIIMTSNLPIGDRQAGDWGGLILLGGSSVNVEGGENTIEGLPAGEDSRHGGTDLEDSCGNLTYLRVEFAGAELTQDNEINAITFGSCGTSTVAHHLQAHYGLDDAFEWFGGTMNAKYLVATAGGDDHFDIQLGWTGMVQYFAGIFYPDQAGDHGIEADNSEVNNSAEPFTSPRLWNATFVGNGDVCRRDCDGHRLRRGLKGRYNNVVITNFLDDTIDFRDQVTLDNIASGELSLNGVLAWSNEQGVDGANTVDVQFKEGPARDLANDPANNFVVADPKFISLDRSDWDLRPADGSPLTSARWILPPDNGVLDQSARHLGAFGEGDDWTEEWTTKLMETDLRMQ